MWLLILEHVFNQFSVKHTKILKRLIVDDCGTDNSIKLFKLYF